MPTLQREYLTRRSFRAPHVEHDASWGGTSAPQEAQRRGFTLARAPHLLQYALRDGTSAPQDGQRIHSFAFSAGCSVDIARASYHTRRASWNGTARKRGFRFLLRHDGWGTAIPQAVRRIAQREIPAFAGMTWVDVGMMEIPALTWVDVGMMEIPALTWVDVGMMESPTCCGPGAIHAARVNGTEARC